MAARLTVVPKPPRVRKKLVRRPAADRSQTLRRTVQALFLALNVWIGVQFYVFVRYYESGGRTAWAGRPPGVEGWLPIAALMNLKVTLLTGHMPRAHPAGMVLLVTFLGISLLFRKAFCGWLCPVGTVSELLWKLGRRLFGRNFSVPRWGDLALRSLKYVLLGLFLFAVGGMSAAAIEAFLSGPYGVIADVKMLNFFRYLGTAGAVVLALLVVASVFVQNFWCRYLCPYGALMGLAALASPARIRRRADVCIDCAKCAKACPALLPVDRLTAVRSAECMACLECVAVCPAEGALEMSLPRRRRIPAWLLAAGVAAVFLGAVAWAQWSGHWHSGVPSQVYFDLIPRAQEFTHP
jgi:polyferredoxin